MGEGYYGILTREMIDEGMAYDLNQIWQQVRAMPQPVTQESLYGIFDSGVELFVAILDHQVIAAVLHWAVDLPDGRHSWISHAAVDVNFSGRGVGRGLLGCVIAQSLRYGAIDLTVTTGPIQGDEVAEAYSILGFYEVSDEQVFRLFH